MPRWRVNYIGKKGSHLGTVEAATEDAPVVERCGAWADTPIGRQDGLCDADAPNFDVLAVFALERKQVAFRALRLDAH